MIGIFDSGVGGLGVLGEIRRLLPSADLRYVADQAAAPYGIRTLTEVQERAEAMTSGLMALGCDVVTLACNTASAAALHTLRRAHPEIRFVGMEPAVKPAARLTDSGKVGVVATAATFQGKLFASVVDRFAGDVEVVTTACPRWVELVEEGILDGPEARDSVAECLAPLLAAGVDVVVLACTHYPALSAVISEIAGPGVRLIDPAPAVARQVARSIDGGEGTGSCHLYSTGDRRPLERAAARLGFDAPVLPWP